MIALPDPPPLKPGDMLPDVLERLARWFVPLAKLLRGNVTFASNMSAEWIDSGEFTGPATELRLGTKFTTPPKAVLLAQCVNTAGAQQSVAFGWTYSSDGGTPQIVTTSFSGLSSGTYRARLLVIRE